MNCHACPNPAGFLDPVGGEPPTYVPACATHRGPDAVPVDPGEMAMVAIFGG